MNTILAAPPTGKFSYPNVSVGPVASDTYDTVRNSCWQQKVMR